MKDLFDLFSFEGTWYELKNDGKSTLQLPKQIEFSEWLRTHSEPGPTRSLGSYI